MKTTPDTRLVETNGITCRVMTQGDGPLVLMIHGFPELWYSWRHQMLPVAEAGFCAAALDVRGYGGTSAPHPADAYDICHLAADIAGIADQLGGGRAILFGHDWGAPIAYATALLYPGKVKAVAGLSVPCLWPSPQPPLAPMKEMFKDRFFYQNYFQAEGRAERELHQDIRTSLRKIFYAGSGDAPPGTFLGNAPADAEMLPGLPDPAIFPAWLSEADENYYVENFQRSGFRGPLNRYRCQDRDWHFLAPHKDQKLSQPSLFIGGERDVARDMIPGGYTGAADRLADCRGVHVIPGAGHWVQQEAPDACNELLVDFVKSVG